MLSATSLLHRRTGLQHATAEGLDGEIYQPGSVDYHGCHDRTPVAWLNVVGDPRQFFPPCHPIRLPSAFSRRLQRQPSSVRQWTTSSPASSRRNQVQAAQSLLLSWHAPVPCSGPSTTDRFVATTTFSTLSAHSSSSVSSNAKTRSHSSPGFAITRRNDLK